MSSTHHISKKTKLNDDTSQSLQVVFEYSGQDVPENVTHVRFHPSIVNVVDEAFQYCRSLKKVELNEGVREIGEYAFYGCKALQSINIPSTLIKIGGYAFTGSILKDIVLNEGLTEIGDRAFQECASLQEIAIPSSITKIGTFAFNGCNNLRVTVLNEGLKYMNLGAFFSCNSLQSITIPSTVTEISSNAFYNNTNLREVVLNDGIERIKSSAFSFTSLEHITTPSSVIEIEEHAFSHCTNLREVVIHSEGVQVGDKAFNNCTSLERFKFPRLSTRLENIIQAGQRGIELKMDGIPAVEWRGGELSIPSMSQEIENQWGRVNTLVELDKEKLDKIVRLIRYYEVKEAATMFELALWKVKIDQADISNPTERAACRIEVPGPVKDTILQYLR